MNILPITIQELTEFTTRLNFRIISAQSQDQQQMELRVTFLRLQLILKHHQMGRRVWTT